MPTKIRNPCWEVQELDGSTLAARLIEIERFQAPNDKSTAWIKDLACLWISPNDMNVLQLKRRPLQSFEDQDYIAVSYSWKHTPILECSQAGKYRITGAQGERIRQSKVRNEVLLRVIRYAIHHKISRFWIDQECSPQDGSKGKQVAMDSMDLVYRYSRYPVGLLAVTLETQDEADKLQELLMGRFVVDQMRRNTRD